MVRRFRYRMTRSFTIALLQTALLQWHDPAPDLSPARQDQPWLVHCETAESHAPDEEAAPGVQRTRWLWATDSQGNALLLDGHLEDGFLAVRGIRQAGNTLAPTSLPALRQSCLDTLRQRNSDTPLELGKVRAARQGEGIVLTCADERILGEAVA